MPLFGAAYVAPNKGTTILYWFRSPIAVLNFPVNGKIQGLFKVFECFSSTFQGKFYFQGLFKTVLYIQVLFKPRQTLVHEHLKLNKYPIHMSRDAISNNVVFWHMWTQTSLYTVQSPFKLRNSKWSSVSSLTVRIFKPLAKALIRLRKN